MITPSNEDIGRKVVYNGHGGREEGVITSFNEEYIFVRYGEIGHGQATRPEDLEFAQ